MNLIYCLFVMVCLCIPSFSGTFFINTEDVECQDTPIVDVLANTTHISVLKIDQIYLGELPRSLFFQSKMTELVLTHCGLKGTLPEIIGKLNNLLVLDLSNNELSGALPTTITKLGKLTTLILSYNQFSSIPSLNRLEKLRTLDIQHNPLNNIGGWPLKVPSNLLIFKANNCGIYGYYFQLGCKNIEELDLSHNRLNGPVPQEIGDFHNLTLLKLNNNCLNGPLPSAIWQLYQLKELNLAGNKRLSIGIPQEIQYLDQLTSLDLEGCFLSGNIPSELGKTNLITFSYTAKNMLDPSSVPKTIEHLRVTDGISSLDIAQFSHLKSILVFSVVDRNTHTFSVNLLEVLQASFEEALKTLLNLQGGTSSLKVKIFDNALHVGDICCSYEENGTRKISFNYIEKESRHVPLKKFMESVNDVHLKPSQFNNLIVENWILPLWAEDLEATIASLNEQNKENPPVFGIKRRMGE